MATHCCILGWKIPWTEDPEESMRLQRVETEHAHMTFLIRAISGLKRQIRAGRSIYNQELVFTTASSGLNLP